MSGSLSLKNTHAEMPFMTQLLFAMCKIRLKVLRSFRQINSYVWTKISNLKDLL